METAKTWIVRLLADRRRLLRLIVPAAATLLLVIVAIAWGAGRLGGPASQQTTTSPAVTEPAATATSAPTATPRPTASPTPTQPPVILVVSARRLNLRDAPSRDGTLLTTLDNGDQLVQLSEPQDDWVEVRTEDGLTGYVFAQYVTEADNG